MKKGRLALMLLASSLLCVPACNSGSSSGGGQQTVITISQTEASIVKGQTLQLTVTGATGNLEWSSSKTDVATVSGSGLVTAVAEGSAVITVKVAGTDNKATCRVIVVGDYFIKEPTEILIKTTFNDTYGQIWQDAAAELMKKEPNLTINYEKYGGSYNQLKDEIVSGVPAGNYPDITVAYPDSVADFITAGVQYDIDELIDDPDAGWTEAEQADYFAEYLDEGRHYSVEGTYSLPIAKSTEAMYYDGDKILGLKLPGVNGGDAITESYINSLTWDELFNVFCPALLAYRETLDADKKKAFLDTETYSDWALVGYDSDDNLFITLAEQYGYGYTSMDPVTGEGHIDFNNSEMKELMKKFNAAYKNKYFTTKGIIGTNVNYRSNVDAMLFSIGSTGGVNYQFSSTNPKNVKVARIPQAPKRDTKLIMQGPSFTILDHSDDNRALASWLFYKQLTTQTRCVAWSTTTGYSPIRVSVGQSDDYLDYMDDSNYDDKTVDKLKAFNAQYSLNMTRYLFSSPVFKGSSEARVQVGGLATKAISDANLTDETLKTLFDQAYENTILKM